MGTWQEGRWATSTFQGWRWKARGWWQQKRRKCYRSVHWPTSSLQLDMHCFNSLGIYQPLSSSSPTSCRHHIICHHRNKWLIALLPVLPRPPSDWVMIEQIRFVVNTKGGSGIEDWAESTESAGSVKTFSEDGGERWQQLNRCVSSSCDHASGEESEELLVTGKRMRHARVLQLPVALFTTSRSVDNQIGV